MEWTSRMRKSLLRHSWRRQAETRTPSSLPTASLPRSGYLHIKEGRARQPRQFAKVTTLASIRGRRITQMQYLLQLSLRTSENSQNANFAEFLFQALG